jgi:hypothetical protein
MSKITIKRVDRKARGALSSLTVNLNRKKFKFKKGDEITVNLKNGKNKMKLYLGLGTRVIQAFFGFRATQLVYKFKAEPNDHLYMEIGYDGKKFWHSEAVPMGTGEQPDDGSSGRSLKAGKV